MRGEGLFCLEGIHIRVGAKCNGVSVEHKQAEDQQRELKLQKEILTSKDGAVAQGQDHMFLVHVCMGHLVLCEGLGAGVCLECVDEAL